MPLWLSPPEINTAIQFNGGSKQKANNQLFLCGSLSTFVQRSRRLFRGAAYHFLTIFCLVLSAKARPLMTPTASKIPEGSSSFYF